MCSDHLLTLKHPVVLSGVSRVRCIYIYGLPVLCIISRKLTFAMVFIKADHYMRFRWLCLRLLLLHHTLACATFAFFLFVLFFLGTFCTFSYVPKRKSDPSVVHEQHVSLNLW